ncbi:MAG TPA: M23 family metallopeptidase [Spirochaetota bacterium]|nr:M23 family metallopeptidase [Spirochaetota bacterium]
MSGGWPITNYHIWQAKKALKAIVSLSVIVIVVGNIVAAIFISKVRVDSAAYRLREGFPIFTAHDAYIRLIKSYPHDPGVEIILHAMRMNESYWDVARRYHVTIDTILGANPFLGSLVAREGAIIAVPREDGVLLAVDNFYDVHRMARMVEHDGGIRGDYRQSIFRIISPDNIRFAFLPDARPMLVSEKLQALYNIRRIFQNPIRGGLYSSLYGDRVDPMFEGMAFHNGIDIMTRMGTPIRPAREGMVSFTGWMDGYGQTVVVQHWDGYVTWYGHCSTIKVKRGDWVTRKDVIALVGSTGRSTGSHLHFMTMRHGQMIDPLLFIW